MSRIISASVTFCVIILGLWVMGASAQEWLGGEPIIAGNTPDLDIDPTTGYVHMVVMDNKVIYLRLDKDGNLLDQEDVPGSDGPIGKFRFGATVAVDSEGKPHVCYQKDLGNDLYDIYYTRRTDTQWTTPLKITSSVLRAYGVRMDIDSNDDVHIIRGEVTSGELYGEATYYKIKDGIVLKEEPGFQKYRSDDRVEIATFGTGNVHIIIGSPDDIGDRRVSYYRSSDNGATFVGWINILASAAGGRTGNPDVFVDTMGTVHFVYGAAADADKNNTPSVRYHRRENGSVVRDLAITAPDELTTWHHDLGIASVAASDDGQYVVVAYLTTDGGQMRSRISKDGGATWSSSTNLASQAGGSEGRDKMLIRANGNRFYVAYQSFDQVRLRRLQVVGDPPAAEAGGPYTGQEGQAITFNASQSTDDGSIVQYAWDWQSDGVYDDSTASPTIQHTYADNFAGKLKLRVTDNEQMVSIDTAVVTIANVAPSVAITGNTTLNEGAQGAFTAVITDPGVNDTHQVSWDFGDSANGTGKNVEHVYADNGSYTLKVTVTDKDSGTGNTSVTVTVNNVAPTANAGGPYSGIKQVAVTLTGAATDPGVTDVLSYSWDLDHNGSFEKTGKSITQTYNDLGVYTIRLKVDDGDGGSDIDTTTVTIGSGAPVIAKIPDQTANEGKAFPAINLDSYVSDPNNTDGELVWTSLGNVHLTVSITNRVATVAPADSEWAGVENITFVAADPLGLKDSTTTKFTVVAVNDPPVIASIPAQTVGESTPFPQLALDNYVTDVDNAKSALVWSYAGNSQLSVSIVNRIATVTAPSPSWFGSETITFSVKDPSNASTSKPVVFTVNPFNDPPQIAAIPEKKIIENQSFAAISLDDYVHDPDNVDSQLVWSYLGNTELLIIIQNHLAAVAVPDSEWVGSEFISFVATDPGGMADTAQVKFTVIGINDPPVLKGVTSYTFDEDDTLRFSNQVLVNMITDPDNTLEQLTYRLVGAQHLQASYLIQSGLLITATPDWSGKETVWLKIFDGAAADSASSEITVIAQPDPPKRFRLVSPQSGVFYSIIPENINFVWRSTSDPDPGDQVTYTWELSVKDDFSSVLFQNKFLVDTVLTFPARTFLASQTSTTTYFWHVIAQSTDGQSRVSDFPAQFTIDRNTAVDSPAKLPETLALSQNYPNPFNPTTNIRFDLPKDAHVELMIYNTTGHLLRKLASGQFGAGSHTVQWDTRDDNGKKVASGVYIYRLRVGEMTLTRKMMLIE